MALERAKTENLGITTQNTVQNFEFLSFWKITRRLLEYADFSIFFKQPLSEKTPATKVEPAIRDITSRVFN